MWATEQVPVSLKGLESYDIIFSDPEGERVGQGGGCRRLPGPSRQEMLRPNREGGQKGCALMDSKVVKRRDLHQQLNTEGERERDVRDNFNITGLAIRGWWWESHLPRQGPQEGEPSGGRGRGGKVGCDTFMRRPVEMSGRQKETLVLPRGTWVIAFRERVEERC